MCASRKQWLTTVHPLPSVYIQPILDGTCIAFRREPNRRTYRNTAPPTGWLVLDQPHSMTENHVHARSIARDGIDWNIVNRWIQFCTSHHWATCNAKPSISIPGFQVIDCETRRIVPLPIGKEFTALSYVWGTEGDPPTFELRLPQRLSLLMEDAIACTHHLRFRYLWVDRYCIDSSVLQSKHRIIQNMDKIYRSAAVTIINAAGNNPEAGLPGITRTSKRRQHPTIRFNKRRIVPLPDIRHEVEQSKWWSRGWTYQEGLLSRRRLVFTPTQVYFQCLETHFCEIVSIPPDHAGIKSEVRPLLEHIRVFPYRGVGTTPDDIFNRIKEFLLRDLSYESDILNAFLGILHRFRSFKEPLYHFWGVPFEPDRTRKDVPEENAFLEALLWTPILNRKKTGLARREAFPSWSWVGWRGLAGVQSGKSHSTNVIREVSLRLQAEDGTLIDFKEYLQAMKQDENAFAYNPCLHLSGWITTVRFQSFFKSQQPEELHTDLTAVGNVQIWDKTGLHEISKGTVMIDPNNKGLTDQLFNAPWPVLLFFGYAPSVAGIILRPISEHTFEKMGVFHTSNIGSSKQRVGDDKLQLERKEFRAPFSTMIMHCRKANIRLV